MKTGMVSVTFRQLKPQQIIELVKQVGLQGVEWGADIHVPPNDIENAKKVALMMKNNGLETISYGSYYRVGESDNFSEILETAIVLQTKNIRVWAGSLDSEDADDEYRRKVVDDAKKIAQMSKEKDITISFEYHGGTLTNTQSSTLQLLNDIDMDNVCTYWQPLNNTTYKENIKHIKELCGMKKLMNIHAYHWVNQEVLMLADGMDLWFKYINNAKCNSILLEFTKNNSIENFIEDANTLKELIK